MGLPQIALALLRSCPRLEIRPRFERAWHIARVSWLESWALEFDEVGTAWALNFGRCWSNLARLRPPWARLRLHGLSFLRVFVKVGRNSPKSPQDGKTCCWLTPICRRPRWAWDAGAADVELSKRHTCLAECGKKRTKPKRTEKQAQCAGETMRRTKVEPRLYDGGQRVAATSAPAVTSA